MWSLTQISEYGYEEVDDIVKEIFDKYKYALAYIGVDFEREDVREAIINCDSGMEEAFQTTISYWYWKQKNHEDIGCPSSFLISAIKNHRKPYDWQDTDGVTTPLKQALYMLHCPQPL